MEQLLFNFEGNHVEVINYNGKALFNPRDVGKCLDIDVITVRRHIQNFNQNQVIKLTNDMISKVHIMNFRKLHNTGENFLTSSGVYKLIFKSRKPNAERFQDWVTDVVLPSIEKHGGYIPGNTPEEIEKKAKEIADSMIKELKDENKRLERNYSDVYRSNEDITFNEYYISECMNAIAEQIIYYQQNLKRDRYTVEDVIEKCGVSYQSIIDCLYDAGWISFDSYNVPQFNALYIMRISPDVVFNTKGFNILVDYFNSKKNHVPKLNYHHKDEK